MIAVENGEIFVWTVLMNNYFIIIIAHFLLSERLFNPFCRTEKNLEVY